MWLYCIMSCNVCVYNYDFFNVLPCSQAYMDAQRKVKPEAPAKLDVPDELVCPICKKLVKDAVIIQCCSESFCYECIQEYLCENEFICPLCKATDVSPETLVPNKALRTVSDT